MAALIKLPEMSMVLFKSAVAPVSVTDNEMYHATVSRYLFEKYLLAIRYVILHVFDVYAAHLVS